MAEYIKREAAIDAVTEVYYDTPDVNLSGEKFEGAINGIPAADVAPVVHGRWEWFDEDVGTPVTGYEREWGWRCSHCGEELPDDYDDPDDSPTFRFCYNCGAKMDGGADNV